MNREYTREMDSRELARYKRRLRRRRERTVKKALVCFCGLFILAICIVLFTNLGNVEASNIVDREKQFTSVEVESGDTVWSIAEEYKTSDYRSTKELVKEILEINGIHENTILRPGNRLMIPGYVDVAVE